MTAISAEHLQALKLILDDRYVSLLPDLIPRNDSTEEENAAKQISRAFNAFVIQKHFDISAQDAASSVVDNFNDNGIDAIYYDESNKCLAVLQGKLHASQDFGQQEAQDFKAGVDLLLKQQYETFNQNVKDRISRIEHYLDECDTIKLIVACTGHQISHHAKTRLNNFAASEEKEDERLSSEVEYIEADKISEWLIAEHQIPQVDAKLKIEKSQKTTNSRLMVHGIIALSDLVELHNEYKKALYEKNIRYFLGSRKSQVNSAIKKTLESQPENFLYLNNGITALCDKLNPKNPNSRSHTHEAIGLSVVNGAQTIASAAEFVAQNPDKDISSAKVMLTLIHAPNAGDFHKEVTKARNFQNPVHISNFVSLDERQESIRKSLKLHGYTYHYRPEEMAASPTSITIDDAISALACLLSDPRHPLWLKSDQLRYRDHEGDLYHAIFETDISSFKLINAVKCYKAIREVVTESESSSTGSEKLIYRHGVMVFASVLMKKLRDKINGQALLDETEIRRLISQPLDDLRQQAVDSFGNGNTGGYKPLGFFRNLTHGTPYVADLYQWQAQLNDDDTQVAERLKATLDPLNPSVKDQYRQMHHINFVLSKTSQL